MPASFVFVSELHIVYGVTQRCRARRSKFVDLGSDISSCTCSPMSSQSTRPLQKLQTVSSCIH